MKKYLVGFLVCLFLLLGGCSLKTYDQLYCLPGRSAAYRNLQETVSWAMDTMSYCAPLTGENQQAVQSADLDGDGEEEYLVFARSVTDRPLQILIFHRDGEDFSLSGRIEGSGTAFDRVEYAQIDGVPGMELIVGRQVSDQVLRNLSVYSFAGGSTTSLLSASYREFVTVDLTDSGANELLLLGRSEEELTSGAAFLYGCEDEGMTFMGSVGLSGGVEDVRRVIPGKLEGGKPAVYVASAAGEDAVVTDVLAVVGQRFTNVSASAESGTSVRTLRNRFVYATDIDEDGVLELPSLIPMEPLQNVEKWDRQLILWYSLREDGSACEKMYTYYNDQDGWYLCLDPLWARRLTVIREASSYRFFIWDERYNSAEMVFSVEAFSGSDREESALSQNRFPLYRGDTVTYAASLGVASVQYGITQETLIGSFHLIRQDWMTGEI